MLAAIESCLTWQNKAKDPLIFEHDSKIFLDVDEMFSGNFIIRYLIQSTFVVL